MCACAPCGNLFKITYLLDHIAERAARAQNSWLSRWMASHLFFYTLLLVYNRPQGAHGRGQLGRGDRMERPNNRESLDKGDGRSVLLSIGKGRTKPPSHRARERKKEKGKRIRPFLMPTFRNLVGRREEGHLIVRTCHVIVHQPFCYFRKGRFYFCSGFQEHPDHTQ